MSGHYCSDHETTFFKKGRMKNYAHPIGDTGEWCNEPEGGGDPIPEEKKSVTEVNPQELGLAHKLLSDAWIAGFIDENLPDGKEMVLKHKLWMRKMILGR